MTPGTYIRLRREAAGRSIDEVALLTSTQPSRDARERALWIADVERDVAVISADIVIALHEVFAFDRMVLVQLIAIHAGADIIAPDVCRSCACSWEDPCASGCGWRSPANDLCTACPDPALRDPGAIALPDRSAEPLPGAAAIAANFERAQRFSHGLAH